MILVDRYDKMSQNVSVFVPLVFVVVGAVLLFVTTRKGQTLLTTHNSVTSLPLFMTTNKEENY